MVKRVSIHSRDTVSKSLETYLHSFFGPIIWGKGLSDSSPTKHYIRFNKRGFLCKGNRAENQKRFGSLLALGGASGRNLEDRQVSI